MDGIDGMKCLEAWKPGSLDSVDLAYETLRQECLFG